MIPDTLKSLAVAIDILRPYERNPRNGDLEAIKESLEANQQYRPIVVNARDNRILAGNHTYAAAMELEWTEIAATFVDVDEEQAARIVLVDNRTNDLAWNDDAQIAEILNELPSLEGTGYDDEALEELLAGIERAESEGLTDPDAVPPVPDEPVTKRGDVWLLGRHRVMCGDSVAMTDVDALMDGKRADMVFTDPPYNVGVDYDNYNDNVATEDYAQFCVDFIAVAQTYAPFVVVTPGKSNEYIYYRCLEVLDSAVWFKKFGLSLGRVYKAMVTEPVLFFGEKPKGRHLQTDHMECMTDRTVEQGGHKCPKPVALVEHILDRFLEQSGVTLDLFGGSGTTLIAADKIGHTCYMMELSEQYVDVICRRFQEYTGTLPILESTKEEHDFVNITNEN